MQVSWLGSENAIAGRALRLPRKRPVHSSAKCIASHIEPPLPHAMSLPPESRAPLQSAANRATASRFAGSARKASRVERAASKDARIASVWIPFVDIGGGL